MKQKYIQIASNGIISNSRLATLSKEYNVIAGYQYRGYVYYLLKRKNLFTRLFNKFF